MKEKSIICLCSRCYQRFRDTGCYRIKRVSYMQIEKNLCCYCQTGRGFDYFVIQPQDQILSRRKEVP